MDALDSVRSSAPDIIAKCCICMSRVREFACVPCYHMCLCIGCKGRVLACPVCRAVPEKIVKIFR